MKPQARALFLDRDGVINRDKGFVHKRTELEFVPGIFELCRKAHGLGYKLVICTNQSGIGRGFFSEEQYQLLTQWLKEQFEAQGGPLSAVYHCPFHPEEGKGAYRKPSLDRKPAPGMFLKAQAVWKLNMQHSIAIGDTARDAEAAHAAGVGTILHLGGKPSPDYITARIASLSEAASYLR